MSEPPSPYPWFAPRIWHGMCAATWLGLLRSEWRSIRLSRIPLACTVTCFSLGNSLLRLIERCLFFNTSTGYVRDDPVIILGHWRSGTTLLHELLSLDPRHCAPNTFQCMAPSHFLLSEALVRKMFSWILPRKRPMDDMELTWESPQEEEFALCNMGVPSPYLRIAFPHSEWSRNSLRTTVHASMEKWRNELICFLERVSRCNQGRLVLKCPLNMLRVPALLEIFPRARFVHIVRDPLKLFPSTVRMWSTLIQSQGFDGCESQEIEEFVLRNFTELYAEFDAAKAEIPAGRMYEISYEDLIAEPLKAIREMYTVLDLGGFEIVCGLVESYFRSRPVYRTTPHTLSFGEIERVRECWGAMMQRYGHHLSEEAETYQKLAV